MASTPGKLTQTKGTAPKRSRKMQRAGRAASALVSPALRRKGFAQAEVVTRWPQIVGPDLAAFTVPIGLRFPRHDRMGATLFVRCESAFAPLLSHKAPRIMEKVNGFFGYQAVSKLEVKQGPLRRQARRQPLEKQALPKEKAAHLVSLVGEGELSPLREAVKSLGEFVLSDAKKSGKS